MSISAQATLLPGPGIPGSPLGPVAGTDPAAGPGGDAGTGQGSAEANSQFTDALAAALAGLAVDSGVRPPRGVVANPPAPGLVTVEPGVPPVAGEASTSRGPAVETAALVELTASTGATSPGGSTNPAGATGPGTSASPAGPTGPIPPSDATAPATTAAHGTPTSPAAPVTPGTPARAIPAAGERPSAATPTAVVPDPVAAPTDAPLPRVEESTNAAPTDEATGTNPRINGVEPTTQRAQNHESTVSKAVVQQAFPEVTRIVTTAAQGPNGSQRITLTLQPEQLGEVRVTLVVRDGSVHVQLAGERTDSATHRALAEGAPELQRLLERSGTDARIQVRDAFPNPSSGNGQASQASQGGADGHGRHEASAGTSYDGSREDDRSRRGAGPANTGPDQHRTTPTTEDGRQAVTTTAAAGRLDRNL